MFFLFFFLLGPGLVSPCVMYACVFRTQRIVRSSSTDHENNRIDRARPHKISRARTNKTHHNTAGQGRSCIICLSLSRPLSLFVATASADEINIFPIGLINPYIYIFGYMYEVFFPFALLYDRIQPRGDHTFFGTIYITRARAAPPPSPVRRRRRPLSENDFGKNNKT